ncbi:MAG TPA: hypothetical protein VF503_23655 [Sphingobium sp.]|uniref:hypothetical protein n=1 Tax=Sphingobium sp. TaxID=1912891 RepID=UPI002ED5E26E
MAKRRGKAGLIMMLLLLSALTSGGVFFWGRQVIAMPACAAFARTHGMTVIDYRPPALRVGRQKGSRINDIDGRCVLINRDGVQRDHDLAIELHGWQRLGAASLRLDLIFCVALVGWGLIIALWPGRKGRRRAG